jgi:hypothetical protein
MEPDSHFVPRRTLTEMLFVVFMRLIAIACLWFGLQYWAMLVGYSLHGMARFDLLNLPWKVAAASLAVLFPVASLGLWLTVSWGAVLWTIAAAVQVSMYVVWPETFGRNTLVPMLHGLVATLYIIFRLSLWLDERRKAERVRID